MSSLGFIRHSCSFMNEKKTTFTQLSLGILFVVLPSLIIGLVISENKLAFTFGIILGTITAIGLLKHMEITLGRALQKLPKAAERYAIRNYIIRYIVNIIVLMIGIICEYISVVGVFIGLISIKISAFIFPYIKRFDN